jgi:hypothetical protein
MSRLGASLVDSVAVMVAVNLVLEAASYVAAIRSGQ